MQHKMHNILHVLISMRANKQIKGLYRHPKLMWKQMACSEYQEILTPN
jgi:hypothetical protein